MTVREAARKAALYRVTLIRNVLRAMDMWGAQEWKRNVLTRQMVRLGPSVPPFPPPGPLGIRSGKLSKTVRSDKARYVNGRFSKMLRAGTGSVRYARIHELGGRTGRNHATLIRKRPYMKPAYKETKAGLQRAVDKAVEATGRQVYGG